MPILGSLQIDFILTLVAGALAPWASLGVFFLGSSNCPACFACCACYLLLLLVGGGKVRYGKVLTACPGCSPPSSLSSVPIVASPSLLEIHSHHPSSHQIQSQEKVRCTCHYTYLIPVVPLPQRDHHVIFSRGLTENLDNSDIKQSSPNEMNWLEFKFNQSASSGVHR